MQYEINGAVRWERSQCRLEGEGKRSQARIISSFWFLDFGEQTSNRPRAHFAEQKTVPVLVLFRHSTCDLTHPAMEYNYETQSLVTIIFQQSSGSSHGYQDDVLSSLAWRRGVADVVFVVKNINGHIQWAFWQICISQLQRSS